MISPKILLLPFMAVFELTLIVVCLIMVFFSPKTAIKINDWSKKLPNADWYIWSIKI